MLRTPRPIKAALDFYRKNGWYSTNIIFFILLGLFGSGLLSVALIILFISYKKRSNNLGERYITIAIVNVALMAMVALFTLIGANTVIGYSPLVYLSPMFLVISVIILIVTKTYEKSNKAI